MFIELLPNFYVWRPPNLVQRNHRSMLAASWTFNPFFAGLPPRGLPIIYQSNKLGTSDRAIFWERLYAQEGIQTFNDFTTRCSSLKYLTEANRYIISRN